MKRYYALCLEFSLSVKTPLGSAIIELLVSPGGLYMILPL